MIMLRCTLSHYISHSVPRAIAWATTTYGATAVVVAAVVVSLDVFISDPAPNSACAVGAFPPRPQEHLVLLLCL